MLLDIGCISPNPYQPRKNFDSEKLQELSDSFKENGIIQPVIVRKSEDGYQLIVGERRFQAAKLAGMGKIPGIIKDVNDTGMLKMSLVENIQRDDLNPLEEAVSYNRLTEEFGLSRENLAEALGKSRTGVTNTIRLLKLPEEVQEEISAEHITRGHALALLGLESDSDRISLCKRVVAESLSVRETEKLVQKRVRAGRSGAHRKQKSPEIASLEDKLQLMFGTRVNINTFKKGGRIEIEYYSDDDLARICDALNIRTY